MPPPRKTTLVARGGTSAEEKQTTSRRSTQVQQMDNLGGGPMNRRITPKESQYTELTRDRAEKLATLRRGRFDEVTWAAFTGFAASLPSAIHSLMEVVDKPVFSLSLPETVDLGVALIFLTISVMALFSRNKGPTSMQYLEHHFGPDPDAVPRRPWFPLFGKPSRSDEMVR